MSMYGNCQHKMTSDGCLSNSYCPPKNEQEDTACRQCDVNMMPGIYCNCQDNLRLNCSQCNGIFCQACITGFVLQKDKCELQKGNCSLSQNTCPHNTFCQRQNTKSCQSCYNISILDKCNCAGTMIQGCLNCDQNKCLTCISSLILYNGNCVDSIPRIDCRNIGARCPTGTYCRQPEKYALAVLTLTRPAVRITYYASATESSQLDARNAVLKAVSDVIAACVTRTEHVRFQGTVKDQKRAFHAA
uniref:Cysteine-rich protein n=1 Tax=Spironucleus salmonicida TaxID=348837 RepID=V6LKJ6_9EUKA|eukprot:EST44246.1 Cysteine-rich protein [Spironucleus salmonicida]